MSKKIVFILVVLSLLFITNQADAKQIDSKYFKGTITDKNGVQVDKIIVPGTPPKNFRMPVAGPTDAAVTISSVPAFDWVYGCSATSAAMMAGHYDNAGYLNMYAGTTNGGVCPMTNSAWGTMAGECPLSATHMGFDGLGVKGHVDDYWVSSLSTASDPYISGSWTPHANADCTGDYMGTNQSAYGNIDGGTTFYFGPDGSPLNDYTTCEPAGKDGCHGLRQFFESRGYTVTSNYSQYIYEEGLTYGFTFAQYIAEIDAGRPVLIQVDGHTMLGYGYDATGSVVYLHDTWDYSSHTMTWGGSYSGMDHYGVGVFVLAPISGSPGVPTNPTPSDGASAVDIDTNISWTNGASTVDVDVYFSLTQSDVTNKVGTALISSGSLITGTDPSGVWSLANDTDYYWRVVCNNSSRASTDGPVWSFTTESAAGIEATISYHGPTLTNFWHVPSSYGDTEYGVKYTVSADCPLLRWEFLAYTIVGSPTGITVHVYDEDVDGKPGVELDNIAVPIANITASTSVNNVVDLTSLGLTFTTGESFFITYTVDGGLFAVNEVTWLSDDGSFAPENRTFERESSGVWNTMSTYYGANFEMFAEAIVEYSAAIPPNFTTLPSSFDFQRTAIGGWKTQTVTLQNAGGGQVIVNSVSIAGDSQIELYDYNTYPDTLFAGEAIQIMVAYGPDVVVTNNAIITVSETSSTRTDHLIPITGEGYIHNSWASGTPNFDQPPMGNQGDNAWSMSTSDAAPGYLLAENFWGLTEQIEAIEFWGINWYHDGTSWVASDVEDPMDFEIKFYTDHTTEYSPDTEVASFSLTLSRTTVDTVTFSSSPVYRYWADLPTPVVLTDGWVSIQGTSVSTPDDPWFLWSQSPVGDFAHVIYDDVDLDWDFDEIDLAFALHGTLLPPVDIMVEISGLNAIISWTSEAGKAYNVYSDTNPYGAFTTLVGTVVDGSGTLPDPLMGDVKKFYQVKSSLPRSYEFIQAAPVIFKSNTIRSIKDSKSMSDEELKIMK